uniref:Dynein light chain n=1 Tax=Kalanchoe fedtschenkoi TaxID=63787 RepID=A0A7N0V3I4_KALFE
MSRSSLKLCRAVKTQQHLDASLEIPSSQGPDALNTHRHHHKPSPLADDSTIQLSSSSSSSASLNSNHKASAARVDARFQHKVLSRSLIADSLDYFLPKPNPGLVRTVSDSRKLARSRPGVASAAATNPNPEKERWGKKFFGGEIVKVIYDPSKEKTRRKDGAAKGGEQRQQVEEEEEDVGDVKKGLAKLEIVGVEKIKGVRNEEGDLKKVSVGRRRSFCGTETSLSSFLSSNGARILAVDMPPFMQIHAIDCARKAYDSLEKFTSKSLALSLKKEFDGVYGPAWHCIVGTGFGSFVTHSVGGFLYFSLDHKMYILLFKTTVQRAD